MNKYLFLVLMILSSSSFAQPEQDYSTTGVFLQKEKSGALINNQEVWEGDDINGARVIKVTKEGVTLQKDGVEFFSPLRSQGINIQDKAVDTKDSEDNSYPARIKRWFESVFQSNNSADNKSTGKKANKLLADSDRKDTKVKIETEDVGPFEALRRAKLFKDRVEERKENIDQQLN